MPFYGNCGFEMEARFCDDCGAGVTPAAHAENQARPTNSATTLSSLPAGFIGGQVIALIGGAMLMIGPFWAWMTKVFLEGVSGLQRTNSAAVALVLLGIAGIALAAMSLALERRSFAREQFGVGVASLVASVLFYLQLLDQVRAMHAIDYPASVGMGIYLCLVGGAVLLIGAFVAAAANRTKEPPIGTVVSEDPRL